MKARRSDKQRSAAFEKFNNRAARQIPRLTGKNKHEISEAKHQAMLDKDKAKRLAKIKAWLKAKAKSIFKVKP